MEQPESSQVQAKKIRVLMVDDSPVFLESAVRFLSGVPWIEMVGQAVSGRDALAQIARLHPDLVLLDLALPDMNGLEVSHRIHIKPKAPRIVMLTMYDTSEYRTVAAAEGVDGFISKAEFGTELLPLIQKLIKETRSEEGWHAR